MLQLLVTGFLFGLRALSNSCVVPLVTTSTGVGGVGNCSILG